MLATSRRENFNRAFRPAARQHPEVHVAEPVIVYKETFDFFQHRLRNLLNIAVWPVGGEESGCYTLRSTQAFLNARYRNRRMDGFGRRLEV